MVRVIMGAKGTGKTKQLIDMINYAAENESGNVVCVELGKPGYEEKRKKLESRC